MRVIWASSRNNKVQKVTRAEVREDTGKGGQNHLCGGQGSGVTGRKERLYRPPQVI